MRSLFILLSLLPARFISLLCQQCGGELYSGGLRLLRAKCCTATMIECPRGLACLRAIVVSPKKNFILSGCHFLEDGLIGCDFHALPHNGTIHRCMCMDQTCQSYFPTGNCTTTLNVRENSNTHRRKFHSADFTVATTTRTAETLISSTADRSVEEFHENGQPESAELATSAVSQRLILFQIVFVLWCHL